MWAGPEALIQVKVARTAALLAFPLPAPQAEGPRTPPRAPQVSPGDTPAPGPAQDRVAGAIQQGAGNAQGER